MKDNKETFFTIRTIITLPKSPLTTFMKTSNARGFLHCTTKCAGRHGFNPYPTYYLSPLGRKFIWLIRRFFVPGEASNPRECASHYQRRFVQSSASRQRRVRLSRPSAHSTASSSTLRSLQLLGAATQVLRLCKFHRWTHESEGRSYKGT